MHEFLELLWLVLAKLLDLDLLLLFLDIGVLLGFGSSWEALPWESTYQEIEENVTNGLKVISTGLLVPDVSVDGSISGSTREVLTVSEWDVLTVGTLVALGQPKINDVDRVFGLLSATNQKVVGLNISVNDSLFMHNLDSLDHLNGDVQNSIEIEFSSALLEKVL